MRPTLLCSTGFFVAGAVAILVIARSAHAMWAALPAILSLPAAIAMMIGTGYATGTRKVRLITTLATASVVLSIAFMVGAFVIFGRVPASAIGAWIVSGNILGAAILVWVFMDSRRLAPGSVRLRDYGWYALRSGSVNLVSLLNYRADIYIVAILADTRMLGMYTIAVTAAETLLTATQVTTIVTSPYVGSLSINDAAQLVARCVRHNVLVAGFCSAALAIVAPFAVSLLYGAAFLPMVPALRVLLIGVFALSLGGPMSSFFTLRLGRPEVALSLASLSAAICIAVSWIMIPKIGLVGAALGSTLAYVLSQTTAIIYFRIVSGISAKTMLLPKASDFATYAGLLTGLVKRVGTLGSAR
jgi:O-antigen/teichoic acid export membrane protein